MQGKPIMSSSAGASTGECARPGVGEGREEYLARVLSVYRFDARITDKTADLSSRAKFKVRGKWVCGADEALVRRTKRAPHDTAEGTAALAMANIGEYVTRVLRERETGSSGGRKRAESADSKAAEPAEKTTPESFMALLQSKKPEQQPCTKASGASRRAGDKPFTLLKQNGKASGAQNKAQKRSADHATAAIKGAAAKERPGLCTACEVAVRPGGCGCGASVASAALVSRWIGTGARHGPRLGGGMQPRARTTTTGSGCALSRRLVLG